VSRRADTKVEDYEERIIQTINLLGSRWLRFVHLVLANQNWLKSTVWIKATFPELSPVRRGHLHETLAKRPFTRNEKQI
jgi:hypothetical protein